jgi:hypothetical protein
MNIPLNNFNALEPSPELANALIAPILEYIEIAQDGEAAKALTSMIRVMAHEENKGVRELFAYDLIKAIYAKTPECGEAAMTFADSALHQFAIA